MKKPRRNDLLLILVLLAAAGGVWAWLYFTRAQSAELRVTVNGVVYGTYPLDEDTSVRIGDAAHYNVLVVQNGEAWIAEASCPDKICIKQGKIRCDGQSIICLPNRLVVETVGGQAAREDAVAG
ncbi:MAG: NusG domain II-containing protein [Oscillospiraceae bacterium]|jgi:hypothetical protein